MELLQPPEDNLRIAGYPDLQGVVAHEIFLVMGQHDFILVDNPGIAALARADVGRNFLTNKEGVNEKFHHPG